MNGHMNVKNGKEDFITERIKPLGRLTFRCRNFLLNFSTLCILNVNNTWTKKGSIMKQTAFWREKNGECAACLKYSVRIFVE